MNGYGFYKADAGYILFEPSIIQGPDYLLLASENATYTYPVDGWFWASSMEDAQSRIDGNAYSVGFTAQPEGYTLAVQTADETEFNKLITLIQLSISQSKMTTSTSLKIKDASGNIHTITAGRFLEMMVDYGMFCYQLRNM